MDSSIRLLGIVPYEGMKTLLLRLAEEYPQVQLDVFVGNMEEGAEIAREHLSRRYDAVISRGGTALLLRELPLPVVEIEISLYDILYALKLSGGLHSKFAMVAYADIAISAQALCDLLHYQVDIFIVNSIEELEPTLRYLKDNQYDTVLCDMTADMIARSIGLNTIFITSGMESIRQALDRALALCRSQKHLRDENALFRALLSGQDTQVAVFDQEKNPVFFQGSDRSPELLGLLQRELDELPEGRERRITRSANGTQYSLRIRPSGAGLHGSLRLRPQDRLRQEPDGDPLLLPAGGGAHGLRQHLQLPEHVWPLRRGGGPAGRQHGPRAHHGRGGHPHEPGGRAALYGKSPAGRAPGLYQLLPAE